MNVLEKLRSRLRPIHARILLVTGILLALLPLSRRTPHAQTLVLQAPTWFREADSRLEVSWTRDGDAEPLGGFTMTFPEGAPASVRREISAPDGKYRLDVTLERAKRRNEPGKRADAGRRPALVEITRQLSLNGGEVRVLLEDTPP